MGTVSLTSIEQETPQRRVRRRRGDLYALGASILATALIAGFASGPPPAWEIDLFRSINRIPLDGQWVLWPIQQLGMAAAIPVGAVGLWWVARSWRPPLILVAVSGLIGWGAANIVRQIVDRGRPGTFLDEVQLGYDVPAMGAAFPSGHAIVVVTLATVLAPYVSMRIRIITILLVVIVSLARLYVGAHMPLDLLGGAAVGLAVGSVVNLSAGIIEPNRAGMEARSHG